MIMDKKELYDDNQINDDILMKVEKDLKSVVDKVWEKVLGQFVEETGLSDATIEINDNNADPSLTVANGDIEICCRLPLLSLTRWLCGKCYTRHGTPRHYRRLHW